MRKIRGRFMLAVIVLLLFVVGPQVPGAGHIREAVDGATRSQSDNQTLSFGEGRFAFDGKTPKGFAEIEYLYLEGGSFKLGPDGKRMVAISPASLKGELQGKGRRTFKLKKAAMESDALTFESQAMRGVVFQFDGAVFSAASEGNFVEIKGRLSKLLNGKKVAEAQVSFFWVEPD